MDLQSEQINELIQSLSKAQGCFESAKKDKTNPFYKSKYADLSSIWDACRKTLSENGLAVVQGTAPAEDGTLMLVTTLAHSSGQWMRSYMPIITQKTDSQSLGSAITYMKRYSLSAMIGISNGEDDDGEKSMGDRKSKSRTLKSSSRMKGDNSSSSTSSKISEIQFHEIEQLINGHDDIRERVTKWIESDFGGKCLRDLPQNHFEKAKMHCQKAIELKYKTYSTASEQVEKKQEIENA